MYGNKAHKKVYWVATTSWSTLNEETSSPKTPKTSTVAKRSALSAETIHQYACDCECYEAQREFCKHLNFSIISRKEMSRNANSGLRNVLAVWQESPRSS